MLETPPGSVVTHNGKVDDGVKYDGTIRSYIFPAGAHFPQDPASRRSTTSKANKETTPSSSDDEAHDQRRSPDVRQLHSVSDRDRVSVVSPQESDRLFGMEPTALGPLAVWRHRADKAPPLARVLLVHGLSEHSGRHRNTIQFLLSAGFEVVRFDLRGSGRSGGRRQWCARFEDYVDDTSRVFSWICSDLDPLPLFLLGHSLGGTIGIFFAASYGKVLEGLILSAPAFYPGPSIAGWKIKLGKLIRLFSDFQFA